MISALKITAERIADCGVRKPMMLSAFSTGNAAANIAGMIAKYFATSLAIENVVNAPRVINSCFPISTISISLVGFESRSTILPGFFRRLRARVHRDADICLGQRRRIVCAVTSHRHEFAALLLALDERHLVFGRGFGEKVVNTCFARDRCGSQRVVAGDHYGRMPICRI